MKNFFAENKRVIQNLLRLGKWILLFAFFIIAFRYIEFEKVKASLASFSPSSILLYVFSLLIGRFIYAYRWKLIGNSLLNQPKINLYIYFHANLLAEFISIVLPSSIGGEVARVLKLNDKGNKTITSTLTILIDRIIGISSMAVVSFTALLLMGQKIEFRIEDLIPQKYWFPLFAALLIIIGLTGVFTFHWLLKHGFQQKIERARQIIFENIRPILLSFLISSIAHILFSVSHYFLFMDIKTLNLIELIAVILAPQLARTIPLSVLGISPGEGLMFASQMMVGVSRETALVITFITLISRYFFALLGFILEMFSDGMVFFKKAAESEKKDYER